MNPSIITFLASFLIWFLFGGLLILWLIDGKIKKEQVLHALMAVLIAWVATQVVKSIFPTERPFERNGKNILTVTVPGDNSFPSSHTAIAFALSTTIWLHDKKVGSAFFFCALLIGLGRILGNVHYPQDIMGGGIIGLCTAFIVERIHFPLDS